MTSWREGHPGGRSVLGWGLALASLAGAACRHDSPRDGLAAYTVALRARDEEQVRARSDAATRSLWAASPSLVDDDWSAVARALDRPVVHLERRARVHLQGGRVVELVREEGRWRVAHGGLQFARADTPHAALVTFMAAYDAGRLDVLRTLIPRRYLSAYAADTSLAQRLEAMASRIEAARPALGGKRPAIDGDRARIPYGRGRAVELVREDGAWRVLDLE